jgi:hypothetical protein
MVQENHPLRDVPLADAFTLLKPCTKKKAAPVDEPLMDAKKVSDVQEGVDPLNLYGFGIIAYRDLMFTLMILFSVLSVLMIPAMIFYSSYDAIPSNVVKPYARLSLGNMGYSTTQCTSVLYGLGKIPLSCPTGTYITDVTQFGINDVGTSKTSCIDNKEGTCSKYMDAEFETKIRTYCRGENAEVCSFDVVESELFTNQTTIPAACNAEDALLFVQYTCTQTSE